jgi:hypothetical protein
MLEKGETMKLKLTSNDKKGILLAAIILTVVGIVMKIILLNAPVITVIQK